MKMITLALSLALPFCVFAQTYDIHSQPDRSSPIIGQVDDKSNVTQIFHKGQWFEIMNNHNGQTGWVSVKPQQAQGNQYQMMLDSIQNQRVRLQQQMALEQEKFNRAFAKLDAQEKQLMQQKSAYQPKADQASTPYTFTSTQVNCNGKTGTKVTKYVWTDKDGHKYQKTMTKKINCSQAVGIQMNPSKVDPELTRSK